MTPLINWIGNSIGAGGSSSVFSPSDIQSKLAVWAKDETADYITDQLGDQNREALTQNSLAGQAFPGRAIFYNGTDQYTYFTGDQSIFDIGNDPIIFSTWIMRASLAGSYTTAPIIGKHGGGSSLDGRYALSANSNGYHFHAQDSAGLNVISDNVGVTVNTWHHVIWGIDSDSKIFLILDGVERSARVQMNGTFGALDTDLKFAFAAKFSPSSGAPNGWLSCNLRDVRMFRNKNITQAIADSLYADEYVSGITEWWMCSGNGTHEHSAISGGTALENVAFTGGSRITGKWIQYYNEYGYAENATFGQIPPDMTTETPTNDALDNALVFVGTAKIHLDKPSGTTFKMADGYINTQQKLMEEAEDLVALNLWFSSGVAQTLNIADIKEFDGARQFYNSTTKELIIIKEGEHLTAAEEASLTSYVSATIPTTYHANTTTLIARFTNSYTDAEKSKIDNLMRLMVAAGLYTKMDLWYMPCIGKDTEARLSWLSSSNDLTVINTKVGTEPYRGLFGRTGQFSTNWSPAVDGVQYTQNDAFWSFKLSEDMKAPGVGSLFGKISGTSVNNMLASFAYNNSGIKIESFINSDTVNGFSGITGGINKTFIQTRTNTTVRLTKESTTYVPDGGSSTSNAPPTGDVFLTDRSGNAGLGFTGEMNYHQHFAAGSYLTDSEAVLFGRIIDNYADGQLILADEWTYGTGFKYKLSDKFILARIGLNILWHDYNNLYYSTDDGDTINSQIAFSQTDNGWLMFAHMFDNGKILLGTSDRNVYKTTTALSSLSSVTVLDTDDTSYTFHTAATAIYQGDYLKEIGVKKKMYLDDGTEIFMMVNYGNQLNGANAALVLYSFGDGLKVAYEFGQHPNLRDDGTNSGGDTGTLLGDSGNSIKTKHGHNVEQNPDNLNQFIITFGDLDRTSPETFYDSKHMEFIYTQGTDSFVGNVLLEGARLTRAKAGFSQMPGDGYYYYTFDGVNQATEDGFWKVLIADIGTLAEHQRLYTQLGTDSGLVGAHINSDLFLCGGGYSEGGEPTAGIYHSLHMWWSPDLVTFHEEELLIPGSGWTIRIWEISNKKYQLDYLPDLFGFPSTQSIIIDFN